MVWGKKGHASGVTADDLAKTDDIGKVAPGKTNLVQTTETGNPWIDHGATCEGKGPDVPGCFMADDQRTRLIGNFQLNTAQAANNFKFALAELKVAELMTKEDDLHWVLSLALDLAGSFVIGQTIKALANVKAGQIQKIQAFLFSTGERARDAGSRISSLLVGVSDDTIKAKVKAAGGFVTKKAKAIAKDATVESQKGVVLSYLDQLRDGCDIGFSEFATNTSATATDAELYVLWEGMQPIHHSVGAYKAALGEKLTRFKKSGALQLGRKRGAHDKISDRRVVWMKHHDGSKTLWYQRHITTDNNPGNIRAGEPGTSDLFPNHKDSFGELGKAEKFDESGKDQAAVERQVPGEFWNEAVSISEAKWGATTTIEDPFTRHATLARDYKARMDAAKIKRAEPDIMTAIDPTTVRTDVPGGYGADDLAKDITPGNK